MMNTMKKFIYMLTMAITTILVMSCANFETENDKVPYQDIISASVKIQMNTLNPSTEGTATLTTSVVMDNGQRIFLLEGNARGNFNVRYNISESHDNVYWLDPQDAILSCPSKGEKTYLVYAEVTYKPTGKKVISETKTFILQAKEHN